ncbi:hypothetical protein EV126DRAFT_209394 [Verticillium dahliae]|nr:hypothetical protein EV126DRAFT_209394 [Verticillium dahliae]
MRRRRRWHWVGVRMPGGCLLARAPCDPSPLRFPPSGHPGMGDWRRNSRVVMAVIVKSSQRKSGEDRAGKGRVG